MKVPQQTRLDTGPASTFIHAEGATVKYRKKPVVVEAIQFDPERWREAEAFGRGKVIAIGEWTADEPLPLCAHIRTLEGTMTALPGDWIIKGVTGKFHSCKPDIFDLTYEPVA